MNYKVRNKILFSSLWAIIISMTYLSCANSDLITYKVTFDSTWSATTHPDNFPANPHFSGLIGVTHNSNYVMWKPGSLASSGIEQMAETGKKFILIDEINVQLANNNAFSIISDDGIKLSPGSVSTIFTISESHPLVSLVSMVAPSPDWFVGVSGLNLMENGEYVARKTVELFVYDSGTDNGIIYTSPNSNTSPPELITKINVSPFFVSGSIKSVGTFTFIKQ